MRDVVMPAVDPIERQIRRVRRRRNLRELQRGLCLLVATASGSAAALVLLALAASPRLFAVTAWSLAAAVGVSAVLLARELARRWLAAARAPSWIDARAHLDGRLVTLMALRSRTATESERFFLPLLAAENVARLAAWRPERLVRRPVPLAALSAALTAAAALALAVVLAPRLRPHVPEIVFSDEPIDGVEAGDTADEGVPDRIVVAPAREGARSDARDAGSAAGAGGEEERDDESALARLPGDVQDRIRRQLWGREWERARDAMTRAERSRGAGGAGRETEDADAGDGGEEPWETAGLAPRRTGRRTSAFERARTGSTGETSDAEAAARGFGAEEDATTVGEGEGEAGHGAGNATDPNVFGPATDVGGGSDDTFELAIDAPVRSERGRPRRASGEPPPPGTDAHPELARPTRSEHPLRRMPVPAAYEPIVREVFARRGAVDEGRP